MVHQHIAIALITSIFALPCGHNTDPAACNGCKLSVQIIGTTTFDVQVIWLAGSENGACELHPAPTIPTCYAFKKCEFGQFMVVVTGNGRMRWKGEEAGEWEPQFEVQGTAKRIYGNAAAPVEVACGGGYGAVSFPGDSAGAAAVCTECN